MTCLSLLSRGALQLACGLSWLVVACGAPAAHAQQPTVEPKPIPAEAFYRHAELEDASLSPSGRWLAVKTGLGGERIGLVTIDLEKGGPPQPTARLGNFDVDEFHWVNDDRLVFTLVDTTRGGGDQRFGGGLLSVRPDGSELKVLIRHTWDRLNLSPRLLRDALDPNYRLLFVPAGAGDEVIVGEYKENTRQDLRAVHPLRLNVITGRAVSLAVDAPPDITAWWFDPLGVPRVAESFGQGKVTVFWRMPGAKDWINGGKQDELDRSFVPQFIDSSGRLFVTTADGKGRTRVLRQFDFATGKPAADAIVSTPGFDFAGGLLSDPGTGRTIGLRLWTDGPTTVWFDDSMKAAQQRVDAKLPATVNRLFCRRCGEPGMVIMVYSTSDRLPGEYRIYRPEGERWQEVGPERKGIDPKRMGVLDLHRIKARDGLEIPVWVTTPPGPKPTAPRPAVVLVHGGPWVRGSYWGWEADAQFLASRGYVVIEPEFRGSAGYGLEHFKAGWKQWGLAMQDDVADAALWAVGKGLVDAKRICIAGASYGGYATLMGLARHPEIFRCGAAWVGVTDPRLLFDLDWLTDISNEARAYSLVATIGDPVKDRDALTAVAPIELASRIKAPVLLAYGAKDRRVPLEHGDRMRASLRAAGNDPEWVLYPDEGHGWFLVPNRVDFAERLERFLAKHLKP